MDIKKLFYDEEGQLTENTKISLTIGIGVLAVSTIVGVVIGMCMSFGKMLFLEGLLFGLLYGAIAGAILGILTAVIVFCLCISQDIS
tara:strand:+ start:38 stop:298 length:261 start_codon:yes stop_codon:yes gene_type:complete